MVQPVVRASALPRRTERATTAGEALGVAQPPASTASRTNDRSADPSGSLASFFGGIGVVNTRAAGLILAALGVLGLAALPTAHSEPIARAVVISELAMFGALAALFRLTDLREVGSCAPHTKLTRATITEDDARRRRARGLAMLAALATTQPILYLLGLGSPASGFLALVIVLYSIDASLRWALASLLVAVVPHLALSLAVALGYLPQQGSETASFFLACAISTTLLFGFSLAMALIFRRISLEHLADLADAGRTVAAQDVLLREARLDLERAAGVGERGRFTEQTLGAFVLGPLLGRGGMGEVYEAENTTTGERAAVKLLLMGQVCTTQSMATSALRRFEREAAIVGRLRSPNIVRLLEVGGTESALPYIAMERLHGVVGSDLLERRGRLAPEEVVDLVDQVACGLVAAQRQGIVHRDIKPSNVFLTDDGVWKILDFGLGGLAGEAGTLTRGLLIGTLGYLAPEQLCGRAPVNHRTDVHALAIVAYEALTGADAFVEREPARLLREVTQEYPVAPSRLVTVPGAVDDVFRVALAKDPADRFDDAHAFAVALRAAFAGIIDQHLRERARRLSTHASFRSPEASGTHDAPLTARASIDDTAIASWPVRAPSGVHSRTEPSLNLDTTLPADPSGLPVARTRVTLAAATEELLRSVVCAPARAVTYALIGATFFSLTQIPFSTLPNARIIGVIAIGALLVNLYVAGRLAEDRSNAGLRRFRIACVTAFLLSTTLIYLFGPFTDPPAYIALALLLFASVVPRRWALLAVAAVAIPHTSLVIASFVSMTANDVFNPHALTTYGKVVSLVGSLSLYGVSLLFATRFQDGVRSTLRRLSEEFRKNVEREALLRDARLALERAIGVGQRGRFSDANFGPFVLGNVIGRGSTSEVYEARHVDTSEAAAVKVLTQTNVEASGPRDVASTFVRDGLTLAALASPHIVRILEVGREAVLPYIAMERLEGDDLSQLLQRRLSLSVPEVVDMAAQLAEGLEDARSRGILHGDISPRNVFLTSAGTWKLLDFGSCPLPDRPGTPGYMAPEQIEGRGIPDHRADVHALGAVIYRALTGHPPFSARDPGKVLYLTLDTMPLRASAVAGTPAALDDVLETALAKEPADRFADARAFARALRSAARNSGLLG